MILSDETLLGLRITGKYTCPCITSYYIVLTIIITANSFIDLVHFIFTIPGVKSFLSEHISQDPLEKYFGRQRQRGNTHENPTSQEFLKNNGALRVVNSIKIDTHRGNTQQHNDTTDNVFISPEQLKKKKKAANINKILVMLLFYQLKVVTQTVAFLWLLLLLTQIQKKLLIY